MNKHSSAKGLVGIVITLGLLVFVPQFLRSVLRIAIGYLPYELWFGWLLIFSTAILIIFALILDLISVDSSFVMKSIKLLLIFSLLYLYVLPFLEGFVPALRLLPKIYDNISVIVAVVSLFILTIDLKEMD
ncbi:MAG: hypothetical protein QXD62_00810 [Candidatus Woesearchaeota archaeon]